MAKDITSVICARYLRGFILTLFATWHYKGKKAMFYIFFLSVVLFFVMFFSLSVWWIRQLDDQPEENGKRIWSNAMH